MIGTIRHLYGGAIVCRIPSEFQDLSNFLPIPDHQEVFVYHLSNTHLQKNSRTPRESDCVLSFEILEYLTNEDDASLARHLFEDLASCNEAAHNEVKTYEQMIVPSSLGVSASKAILVTGVMEVAKGHGIHREASRCISVLLYILRLPDYQSDILVSYNFPLDDANIDYHTQLTVFKELIKTIRIVDDKLFEHRPTR